MSAKIHGAIRHPLRVTIRAVWFGAELAWAALRLTKAGAFSRKDVPAQDRARWLQKLSRRLLRVFAVQVEVSGAIPSGGLLVSNHLGYLDIVALSSQTPAVFVAKQEVRNWPVFGWFAQKAGTIFVQRERRIQTAEAAREIGAALQRGALVAIFPEGTSSGGATVLPFKSSLLEPATRCLDALSVASIRYELDDGEASEEVCYWKDMTLVPHLLNLLSQRTVRVSVRFAALREGSADRKETRVSIARRRGGTE